MAIEILPFPSHRKNNLTGHRVGKIVVLGYAGEGPRKYSLWACRCDCGNELIETYHHLKYKPPTGCKKCTGGKITHGMTNTRTYRTWHGMLARCTYPSSKNFRDYGGRGITVCERWQKFENFLADMGERPAGMTIDRRDNDGNYEPGNCRWATDAEQSNNRRSSQMIEHGGERLSVTEWARRLGGNRGVIARRLKNGWSVERAVTTPLMQQFSH